MKKLSCALVSALLVMGMLVGCGGGGAPSAVQPESSPEGAVQPVESEVQAQEAGAPRTTFAIVGLKGPTTMGMVGLMSEAENGGARHDYNVEMYGTADEIVPQLVSGGLDIALVPANLAAVLYQNPNVDIQVAAINTLGVLYVVETGESVESIEDLRGRVVYSTGKGTTPEFALHYILQQNGLDPQEDLEIEFKSEATEIAALLASEENAVAVLPQPYVTAVSLQNENLRVALDLTEEWDRVSTDSQLVTGVLVVRTAFAEENREAFDEFLEEYAQSIAFVNANVEDAAELVVKYGIMESPVAAAKALPACNIVYIEGAEMKEALAGYLAVLYEQDAASVGGALPDADFYYGA